MRIKKYPQSHLLLTNDLGKKLIIDPGYLTFNPSTGSASSPQAGSGQEFKVEDFQGADLYLITHQHADHLDPQTIKEVIRNSPVYGNSDVVNKLKEVGVNGLEVTNSQEFSIAAFNIKAVDLPHFQKPGVTMPPNTGYVVDGVFFHPGDGWELEGLQVHNAAIPISSPPEGELKLEQGLTLAKSLQAKVVIPIHYDAYPADPNEFAKMAANEGIRTIILSPGEETEI
ncbi:MBL fold metallo-hydrolase [Candidatus Daviesbacteria bacterium]|nr:MBL fold metallo-hydrolase [Candidatus Daviesbacteria bacterium]